MILILQETLHFVKLPSPCNKLDCGYNNDTRSNLTRKNGRERKKWTLEVVDRQTVPNDHPTPIGCRWLYTLKDYPYDTYQKDNPSAELEAKFKARLIVQGMNEDSDDTYSLTESIMLAITLAMTNRWEIRCTDVSTAFLHAGVSGNPYFYPPETENLDNTNTVWKLNNA